MGGKRRIRLSAIARALAAVRDNVCNRPHECLMWRFVLIIGFVLALAATVPAANPGRVEFNFQIRPLLSDRCFKCHGPDEQARKKKLRLDQREGVFRQLGTDFAVVKPGDTNHSEMIRRIFSTDPGEQMPPPESNVKLSAAEKNLLLAWVADGAEFKPHWSLIPVRPVTPPAPSKPAWVKNPIDDFVLARLD